MSWEIRILSSFIAALDDRSYIALLCLSLSRTRHPCLLVRVAPWAELLLRKTGAISQEVFTKDGGLILLDSVK